MTTKTITVPNISCGHCVATIQDELGLLDGVTLVMAEADTKSVTVNWDEPPASWDQIHAKLVELSFPPAES